MKVNNEYLIKLLGTFDSSDKSTIDVVDLQKAEFNIEDENFIFHMHIMTDKGLIERNDKESGFGFQRAGDGSVCWWKLPLRLTASGHEYYTVLKGQKNDDLLEVMYRQGCSQSKAVALDIMRDYLPNWNKEDFWNIVESLRDDNLITVRRTGRAIFTLDGIRRVEKNLNPNSTINQNILNVGTTINSQIQQASMNSDITQVVNYTNTDVDDLRKLVNVFEEHINDLFLDEPKKRKANIQVATIKAQLDDDEPDQVILKQAGRTLRNITEGAIGSLIATAAIQPGVWTTADTILKKFFG